MHSTPCTGPEEKVSPVLPRPVKFSTLPCPTPGKTSAVPTQKNISKTPQEIYYPSGEKLMAVFLRIFPIKEQLFSQRNNFFWTQTMKSSDKTIKICSTIFDQVVMGVKVTRNQSDFLSFRFFEILKYLRFTLYTCMDSMVLLTSLISFFFVKVCFSVCCHK